MDDGGVGEEKNISHIANQQHYICSNFRLILAFFSNLYH